MLQSFNVHKRPKVPTFVFVHSLLSLRLLLALGSVLHLLVGLLSGLLCGALVGHLLCGLGGSLSLKVGLPLLLLELALLLSLGLSLGAALVLFLLAALVEALDDRGGDAAELLVLADVLGLGGVLAVLVKPVLLKLLAFDSQGKQGMKKLTSRDSHLALIFSFSSSLANSA